MKNILVHKLICLKFTFSISFSSNSAPIQNVRTKCWFLFRGRVGYVAAWNRFAAGRGEGWHSQVTTRFGPAFLQI